MKILVVKMSSMGDVIHCLPAVTDLLRVMPDAQIDWVVEEGFADIVNLHPGINRVLPVAIRRWRASWLKFRGEVSEFRRELKATEYDRIVDAQGLIKSAVVTAMAKGEVVGFDRESAREPLATLGYHRKVTVDTQLHAIERQRLLFAGAFNYEAPDQLSYGIRSSASAKNQTIIFFHGTTWESKHWPDQNWLGLAELCANAGYRVKLPYLTKTEEARAHWLAKQVEHAEVIPPSNLSGLADELQQAAGAIAVDTGLGHLAAALDVPMVGLYGPTSPTLTGFHGPRQVSLAESDLDCAPCLNAQCRYKHDPQSSKIYPPCFEALTAEQVFAQLKIQLDKP